MNAEAEAESTTEAVALRVRALAHLTRGSSPDPARGAPSDALGVLFRLASSPVTASSALALLHELQVLQVEVDMQNEDLRRSRVELETRMRRQQELYESCPTAYLTLDQDGIILALNRTATVLLAGEGGGLLGHAVQAWLTPESAVQFQALLDRLRLGAASAAADLVLAGPSPDRQRVHAQACPDPAGTGYLLTLMKDASVPVY